MPWTREQYITNQWKCLLHRHKLPVVFNKAALEERFGKRYWPDAETFIRSRDKLVVDDTTVVHRDKLCCVPCSTQQIECLRIRLKKQPTSRRQHTAVLV